MNKLASVTIAILCCVSALRASRPEWFHQVHADRRLEFDVPPGDYQRLRTTLIVFGKTNGLQVADFGAKMPATGGRPLFWLRLVEAEYVRIDVLNIRREGLVYVWIYELRPDSNSESVITKLEDALHAQWPNIRLYVDQ